MMRYMLEETRIIKFLVDNGPRCVGLTPSQCQQISESATSRAVVIEDENEEDSE